MKKLILPIFVGCLSVSFTLLPGTPAATNSSITAVLTNPVSKVPAATIASNALTIYKEAGLAESGLPEEAFLYAWKGYQYLLKKQLISRDQYLTICDFSQSSSKKRLYIVDVENHELVTNTYVAHGKNSGGEYATHFSNTPESLESSLGFYITRNTYTGKHGLSLRIDGVDPGYNTKAMERTIVIHGAAYVDAARAKAGVMMGRSWGCPAVPAKESASIITTIKNGTCFFIYHPKKNYLHGSKILNG